MYQVYCYTSPSGKIYVGQTGQSIKARAGKDGINYQQCPYFYKAIQKYGLENFKVAAYDKEGNKVGEWNSVAEASRALEISRPNISKVLNGERPYAGGYSWKKI